MIRYLKHTFVLIGAVAAAACSDEQETGPAGDAPFEPVEVTTRVKLAEDYAGTCVLVFAKKDGLYRFHSEFDGPWSEEGTATAVLGLGDYKFLFFRSPSLSTVKSDLVTGVTTPEQFGFTTKSDANGYVLPVDEIFLPTPQEVETEYHIADPTVVRSELYRAVSRVDILLKRGQPDGNGFSEMPYTGGRTVLEYLDNLSVEISGVGTTLTPNGSGGSGTTSVRFTAGQAAEVTPDGFARFTGPLVFPPPPGGTVTVAATFNPLSGSPFPALTGSAPSGLSKNMILEVTLWITNDYKFVDITAETVPIEKEAEGDSGLWQ